MQPLNEIRNYMGNYHLKSGVYHYYRSEFGQAIGFLRRALADETLTDGDRRSARAYLTLGFKGQALKHLASGEIEAGLEDLAEAKKVSPTFPDLHFIDGQMLEATEDLAGAVRAYRSAIEHHRGYLEAHVALGRCLIRAGLAEEAATAFEAALEVKHEALDRPFAKGLAHLKAGRSDEALESFREVFHAAPVLADEHLQKALDRIRGEEYERALEDFDRALELNPGYPDLHNYRGLALFELERIDEAVDAFRRSAELGPRHVTPRLNLALALLRSERRSEAQSELEKILSEHPEDPVAAAMLAAASSVDPTADRREGVKP